MSGLTGKNSLSIRKKDVKESRTKATGFQKLVFAHKASAGDTGINLSALTVPPEMSALGFTNPTSARLLEAKLFQFQDNLALTSSAKNSLVKNLSYTVPSNSQINFEGFTAEEGEIFIGVLDSNPVNAVTAADARALAVTGTLTAGQTDINVGQPFELNKFPGEQAGAVMVFVDGVLQTRNSANSSTNQDGNYYEVGSQGIASVIRMNSTDAQDRSWVVVSNGALVEPPRDSSFAAIEKVSGQVDSLIPTVAALAGVPETDFQAAPNSADLKVFGDRVLQAEADINSTETRLDNLESLVKNQIARYSISGSPALADNTFTGPINFNSVDYDPFSLVTTGSGWRYTTTTGGVIRVTGNLRCDFPTSSGIRFTSVVRRYNSSGVQVQEIYTDDISTVTSTGYGGGVSNRLDCEFLMDAGDYLQVYVLQGSGAVRNITNLAALNWISFSRVVS